MVKELSFPEDYDVSKTRSLYYQPENSQPLFILDWSESRQKAHGKTERKMASAGGSEEIQREEVRRVSHGTIATVALAYLGQSPGARKAHGSHSRPRQGAEL